MDVIGVKCIDLCVVRNEMLGSAQSRSQWLMQGNLLAILVNVNMAVC